VTCWGNNANGQIGDGTSANIRTAPTNVPGLTNIISVAAGGSHTCALTASGSVKCWGANAQGQLGTGNTTPSSVPVDVPGLTQVTSITAGASHTCARRSFGAIRCWGNNADRQLGVGSTNAFESSPQLIGSLTDAVMVTAGANHTCALRSNGNIQCWGKNDEEQVGVPEASGAVQANPVSITSPADGGGAVFTAVSAGGEFTCARRVDGLVFCWGDNDFGQFGNRTIQSQRFTPEIVLLRVLDVEPSPGLMVSTGFRHACAIIPGEEGLQCWGRSNFGQTGTGIAEFRNFTSSLSEEVLEVATGNNHTCSLGVGDRVRCWGDNSLGQVGNGNSGAAVTARSIILDAGSGVARNVSAGGNHTCAPRSNGTTACWGRNMAFEVAPSGGQRFLSPILIPSLVTAERMVLGANHTMVRSFQDVPGGWGDNRDGRVHPSSPDDFISGQNQSSGFRTVFQVAAGSTHGCEVQVAGTISCRGSNSRGQLGVGESLNSGRSMRRTGGGLTDFAQVATGSSHTCALRGNGRVMCWGMNNFGQLGDGTLNNSATARDTGLTNAIAVDVGSNHSCALLVDGRVSCWGRNDFGQADGTTAPRTTPTIVSAIAQGEAVAVTAGFQHTCVLRSTGGVRCWGRNQEGQLGNAGTTDSLIPVRVQKPLLTFNGVPISFTTLNNMASVESGPEHVCGVTAAGAVMCWGRNPEGQLGDGTSNGRDFANIVVLP
jgi:alpha-tubulin suppressor-like RCC1 family protein